MWACHECWKVFHIHCINRWRKKSGAVSDDSPWRCPGCQHTYKVPTLYTCWCGRAHAPERDPYLPPHSCGNTCGKRRSEECAHLVRLPTTVCVCVCACVAVWLCESSFLVPNAIPPLSCALPQCDAQCHPGPCPPCSALGALKTCGCGRSTYRLRCGVKDPRSGCGALCRKVLACRNPQHRCTRRCHDGPCQPCAQYERQWCYCGRASAMRRCGAGVE